MRLIFFGLWLVFLLPAQAEPRQSLVPGGIAIIPLVADEPQDYRFRGKPVLVADIGGVPSALVGLPLGLQPGEHYIERRDSG